MNIIGLCLRNNKTSLSTINANDKRVYIKDISVYRESLIPYILSEKVDKVSDALSKIKKKRDTHLYITYPSFLGHNDCFLDENVSDQELAGDGLRQFLFSKFTGENPDDYYADASLIQRTSNGLFVSANYLDKKIANVIFEAAINAGFQFVECEPEAVAVLRITGFNGWGDKPCCLIEVDDESTVFTCYDPSKGMFSLPVSGLGKEDILNDNGIDIFTRHMTIADINFYKSFGISGASIVFISDYQRELMRGLTGLKNRFNVFDLPAQVISKFSNNTHITHVGIALKPLAERINNL